MNRHDPVHYTVSGIALAALLVCGNLHAATNGAAIARENAENTSRSNTDSNPRRNNSEISYSELVSSIKAFNRNNEYKIVDPDTNARTPVADRIALGFQQNPPRSVKLEDGTQIFWGWQEGQAWTQSIAIFDGYHKLKLVGAVDNVPKIFSWRSMTGLDSIKAYDELLSKRRSAYLGAPTVTLFAGNQVDADKYYRFVVRWLQADLLGFNSECGNPVYVASCALAEKVTIPAVIKTVKCSLSETSATTCALHIPEVSKSEIPLDLFKQ